jgi:hypothetical protein
MNNIRTLQEFRAERLARANPPRVVHNREALRSGAVYIAFITVLYSLMTYFVATQDIVWGVVAATFSISTVLLMGFSAKESARRQGEFDAIMARHSQEKGNA